MSLDGGRPAWPYAQLILVMALWGSAFATSKLAVDRIPPVAAALLRFGGGAIVLAVVIGFARRRAPGIPARHRTRAGLAGVLGVFAYNALFFWALGLAPSIDGSIIVPVLSPILTTALAVLSGRDTAALPRIVGLCLGLAGAVVFFLGIPGAAGGGGQRLAGDLAFALAAACWALYTFLGPRVLANVDPLRATGYGTAAGAVLLAALAAPHLGTITWAALPAEFWINMAYLVAGPTAIAYVLYYQGVRAVGSPNAATMMFAVPVFGAGCATLLLGESLSPVQAVGGVVMLAGAFLAVTQGRLPVRLRRPTRPLVAQEMR